jgi:hypothetical protein
VSIATIIDGAARRPVVVDPERGALPVDVVLPEFTGDAYRGSHPVSNGFPTVGRHRRDNSLGACFGEVSELLLDVVIHQNLLFPEVATNIPGSGHLLMTADTTFLVAARTAIVSGNAALNFLR